ncbi:MAG: TIGR03557 family F420-dependent LLM class oxidoreductase [Candidatus Caldarchaeum sp.]|nr:TIGR03557 family F420-dependent LLM class oxidoreductase [Candidatus Caldarchaeum sp.]
MVRIGFTAALEQYQPSYLLELVPLVEKAGFDSVWCSDHFHPWFHTNAAAGFAWVWMAAAAERSNLSFGTAVTCPTMRYHPAIVAQAFATLGEMYPGRIFLGVGTGEALNETPLGYNWPSYKTRYEMLEEAIKIIRLLWTSQFVNYRGKYYNLKNANLYTKPSKSVKIYVAASGPKTAELAGKMGDGLLTIPFPESHYKDVLFPALAKGAQEAGRNPATIDKSVEVYVSYDEDYDKALQSVKCWSATLLPFTFKYDIHDPRELESYAMMVGEEHIKKAWLVSPEPEDHIKHIEKHYKIGFNEVHVTSSSPDQRKTIEMYAKKVLPYLKSIYRE